MAKKIKFRKRDILISVIAVIAVFATVIAVAAAIEHAPGKESQVSDSRDNPPVSTPPPQTDADTDLEENISQPPVDTQAGDISDTPEVTAPPHQTEPDTGSEENSSKTPTESQASKSEDTPKAPPAATQPATDIGLEEDKGKAPEDAENVDDVTSATGFTGKYNNNIKNILVLGIDKPELAESDYYRSGGQCDVIMVVSMDLKTKEFFIVSLNRDLAVPVENFAYDGSSYGVVDEQLALAYAYGDGGRPSGRNVMQSLQWYLSEDMKFLGYIASPIPIVRTVTDAVGGVEVTVEDDFTGVDGTLIRGQTVNLNGEQAENFVRARMTMKESNTNALRMNRQIQFMESFMNKAKNTMTANDLVKLYDDVLGMVKTDMSTADITQWIINCYDYKFKGFYRIDGVDGERLHDARCTYEDPENVRKLVQELYYIKK